jgi:hypothetical protein
LVRGAIASCALRASGQQVARTTQPVHDTFRCSTQLRARKRRGIDPKRD